MDVPRREDRPPVAEGREAWMLLFAEAARRRLTPAALHRTGTAGTAEALSAGYALGSTPAAALLVAAALIALTVPRGHTAAAGPSRCGWIGTVARLRCEAPNGVMAGNAPL